MFLYNEYLQEREGDGRGVYHNDKGFVSYSMIGSECFIVDMFVRKEFRQKKVGSEMLDSVVKLAQERGYKFLTCSVCPKASNTTQSINSILAYGFKLYRTDDKSVFFLKEI